jgi:DNA repair protein RecN (Recombination protein N)
LILNFGLQFVICQSAYVITHLSIKNYALIKSLEIEPSQNLNVVTGETGAGKSIMLGALGLLLGNRADSKVLLNENEKCVTEATFEIDGYGLRNMYEKFDLDYSPTTVLRREINPGGKSRAFINDTPVTLDTLRAIGNKLMDIHSQHETLELGKKQFQLELIDVYSKNEKIKQAYLNAWRDFKAKEAIFQELTAAAQHLRKESDFVRFQLSELESMSLQHDEQTNLEEEVKLGEHAEEIKTRLGQVISLLRESENSSLNLLSSAKTLLGPITSYAGQYQKILNRLESARLELDDIASEIEQAAEEVEFNPEQIKLRKDRLDLIYRLMKKHNVNSIPELLSIQEQLEETSIKTANLDKELDRAKQDLENANHALLELGGSLSASRKKSLPDVSKQLVKLLQSLGIPQAAINISHETIVPSPTGKDLIEINFSANKGVAPRPLSEVASGGEFSRLMFSIKYIMAEKTLLPTLILDEIDSGVSGAVAVSLGKMMKQMAANHQLIAISHLPQIAAKADSHFIVYKDNRPEQSVSLIKKLDAEGRVEEIAKMIGGAKPSSVALENARELIAS